MPSRKTSSHSKFSARGKFRSSRDRKFRTTTASRIQNKPDISKLVLFNKPFNTLSQFTGEAGDSTLSDFIDIPEVYAAGRLDKDSEGLLILTNDGKVQHQLSHPKFSKWKTYLVQVEGEMNQASLSRLTKGVELKDGLTKPAKARIISQDLLPVKLWPRTPPVRERKSIPTSWLELSIAEGKNRQVRRMTAAVGYPTLRLIRVSVGQWHLEGLQPGEFKLITL